MAPVEAAYLLLLQGPHSHHHLYADFADASQAR
jgi:hypothetical protein